MGDLSEKERDEIERELQWELEEVVMESRKKKLTCFQKTRNRVIKKGDTTKASIPVNSPFTLEELIHMIDFSINSKYGVDLWNLMDSVWGSMESLRQEFKQECENLSRQIRVVVQQILGEAREKQGVDSSGSSTTIIDLGAGNTQGRSASVGISRGWGAVNPNLQQLFNQAHAYEPGALQLVSDTCFPRPSVFPTAIGGAHLGMSGNVREQVTRTLREFDLEPRGQVRTYQKPYLEFFDTVPYPRGF
jgi:hypothetical protein